VAKWKSSTNDKAYNLNIQADGTIGLGLSNNGSTTTAPAPSTVATNFAAGTFHWIRATWFADLVNYYTSDQPQGTAIADIEWVQLGDADQTFTFTGTIDDNTAPVEVGSFSAGASNLFTGAVSRALVIASTDPTATPALDFNANDYTAGKTFESSATGEVWTLNGNVGVHCPKGKWADVDGSSDGWTSPDSAAASITGGIFLAGWGAPDDWTPAAADMHILGKYELTGDNESYGMGITTEGYITLVTSNDGTNANQVVSESDTATGFTNGTLHGFGVALDLSANTATYYTTSDSPWTPPNLVSWTQLGDPVTHTESAIFDSTALVTVGGLQDGVQTSEWTGRIMRAYAIASTDPTVAPAWDFDLRNHVSGTTATMTTGEVWTAVGNGTVEGGLNPIAPFKEYGKMEPIGYLAETAGANECLYSDDLTAIGWTEAAVTATRNTVRGLDGQLTGHTVAETTATSAHQINTQNITTVDATEYTLTFVLKKKTDDWIQVSFELGEFGAEAYANFNLSTGLIGTEGTATTAYMKPLGNGWYECSINAISTAASGSKGYLVFTNNTDGARFMSYTGVAASDVYVATCQFEKSTFPTSYIPTTTTAVTRDKDELTYASAGNAEFPMTMMCDVTPGQITAVGRSIVISDGTANERANMTQGSSGLPTTSVVDDGGSTVANVSAPDTAITGVTYHNTSVIALNNVQNHVDGIARGTTDTSATMPTVTTIGIGQDQAAGGQPSGHINNVRIYPKVLNANEIKSRAQS